MKKRVTQSKSCSWATDNDFITKCKPARLSFKLHYISVNDIPGADDLKEAFEQCKEYWDNGSADRQADEFNFSNTTLQYFEKETIPVLGWH